MHPLVSEVMKNILSSGRNWSYRARAQANGEKNLAALIAISNKYYQRKKIQGAGKSANVALLFKKWSKIISKLHQTTNIMKLLLLQQSRVCYFGQHDLIKYKGKRQKCVHVL